MGALGSGVDMLVAPRRLHAGTRLVGIDAARALAFGGMLLAHFAATRRPGDPGWLQAVDNAADGRSAPLFCLLLGVGAGLLAARGTSDLAFLRRGLVLFAIGMLVWPLVDRVFLILPHYGLLLAAFPLVRRLPTRWMLPVAGVAFLIPSVVVATFGAHGLRTAGQPSTYGELLDAGRVLREIVWTGGYPVVGWIGFVVVGAWLVRRRVDDRRTQWRLLAGATAVALTQPVVAAAYAATGWPFLDSAAHSNQTAWYVLATATAVAAVAGFLIAARRTPRLIQPLVPLGQMALTAYLAHIAFGQAVVYPWLATAPPLIAQVAFALAVFVAFGIIAAGWLARHRRGPLETAVRALAR